MPEVEQYRIVPAPHAPLISRELFATAQAIRRSRVQVFSNHGRAYCGHLMTPHYVFTSPTQMAGVGMPLSVITSARNTVMLGAPVTMPIAFWQNLVAFPEVIERVIAQSRRNADEDTLPIREALARNEAGLQQIKGEIDTLLSTITTGNLNDALLGFLNDRASELKLRREELLIEQRRLKALLAPIEKSFDEARFRAALEMLIAFIDSAQSGRAKGVASGHQTSEMGRR